jgi:hypothetical protein
MAKYSCEVAFGTNTDRAWNTVYVEVDDQGSHAYDSESVLKLAAEQQAQRELEGMEDVAFITMISYDVIEDDPPCEHIPDWATITRASGFHDVEPIVDVTCKKCGCSGSFRVDAGDVNW